MATFHCRNRLLAPSSVDPRSHRRFVVVFGGNGTFTAFRAFSENDAFKKGHPVPCSRRKRQSLFNSHQRSWWISLDLDGKSPCSPGPASHWVVKNAVVQGPHGSGAS